MSSPTEKQAAVSSEREIENLISSYAYRNDDADFAGLGDLYADAVFTLDGMSAHGREEMETAARGIVEVGEDGRSTTTHEITNIVIEIDEEAGTAVGHAYWTLYRTVSGTPRRPVLSGRYLDRFERRDGRWRFAERNATTRWRAAA
ncbi:nuclear transport factor 2 family protein [Streptosporangium sp. NPDC002721]|uniref:nuclear transport factor 2 family protein n=1 Tax=Streptosporangium sp. NPDC002721 TaxID=3366188 RepID=UPI003698335D